MKDESNRIVENINEAIEEHRCSLKSSRRVLVISTYQMVALSRYAQSFLGYKIETCPSTVKQYRGYDIKVIDFLHPNGEWGGPWQPPYVEPEIPAELIMGTLRHKA